MRRGLGVLVAGLSVTAIHSQSCPPLNFVQGSAVIVADSGHAAGLQRQPDGSLVRRDYKSQTPFDQIAVVPNYQSAFLNCTAASARTFRNPPGWVALADKPGAVSREMVVSDFLGNGTPVTVAYSPRGQSWGKATDTLEITLFNADGTHQTPLYYPAPQNSKGVLVADLNHDGKKDVVMVSAGPSSSTAPLSATIAVYLGNGDGTVQTAVLYTADKGPLYAVASDFDGDNNLDLAVANGFSSMVSILLGKGDGTFAAPVNYPVASGTFSMALGDFNGDGRADLALAGSKNLSMLFGNGNATFRAAVNLTQTVNVSSMATGDFNKDGKLDLAVSDANGGTVSILLGDGQGKFASQNDYVAGYLPGSLFATDLDGDGNLDAVLATGHPDVLVPNYYGPDITAFFGRGDGTLIGPPTYQTGSGLSSMALADFDGDGKPDLAVAARDAWILLSRGDGSFKTPLRLIVASSGITVTASSVAAADLNGDGKQDLAVGNERGVYILTGKGDGTFQAPVTYSMGGFITSVKIADFNGDGKLDVAASGAAGTSSPTGSAAGVLLGNGDGTFQSVKSLASFGVAPKSLTVGDFNKDGRVDLAIADFGRALETADKGAVLVYLGQGNGSFQNPVSYPAGFNPTSITVTEVNGDASPDILVTTGDPDFTKNFRYDVGVLLGNGNGTFRATSLILTDFGPSALAVADLNGDGKPDLAVAHCCGQTDTTFMFGNGDGTFQPEIHLPAASSSSNLLVTDLNGDGKPDLLIGAGSFSSTFVTAFVNLGVQLNNVNAASFLSGPLAPDSFVTAQGTGLAVTTTSAAAPYPASLGGTTVSVRDSAGVSQPAGIQYVSPTQVNYIVPHATALGLATITITSGNGTASSASAVMGAVGPGVFLFGGTNLVAANVLRVKADTSQSAENVYAVNAGGAVIPAPIDLGPATDQVYLLLYATGLRGHSSASSSVIVTASGVSLPVLYAGAQPDYPGLDQVNVLLPRSLLGKGDVTIQVTVDGKAANSGHVTIK